MTVLHLSDTHFGTERAPVVEALRRFASERRPSLAILSGDITQRATAAEFRAARAFVDSLGVQVLAIPGNHDLPLFNLGLRLVAPYARFHAAFGPDRSPVHEDDQVFVACVDTTRWWRHKDGQVSTAQVERVEAQLRAAGTDRLRIVVVHQPVCVTRERDRRNLLHGREAALRRWVAAGVDLVLGGHIHLPYVCALSEHLAGLTRPAFAVQAGTAVSSRLRHEAGNSVNLIHPLVRGEGARHCRVERWDYIDSNGRFECVADHRLPVDAGASAGR